MKEFMMHLPEKQFKELQPYLDKRGIKIQELLRNVVIPEWLEKREKS